MKINKRINNKKTISHRSPVHFGIDRTIKFFFLAKILIISPLERQNSRNGQRIEMAVQIAKMREITKLTQHHLNLFHCFFAFLVDIFFWRHVIQESQSYPRFFHLFLFFFVFFCLLVFCEEIFCFVCFYQLL